MRATSDQFATGATVIRQRLGRPPWILRHNREILFVFLVVCIFLNYLLVPALNLYLSHVATVALFSLACLGWWTDRRRRARRYRSRHWNLFYLAAGAYLVWRLWESRQDIWFFGDCGKLVMVLLAATAFWALDPKNAIFSYLCRMLPAMLALAIGISLVQGVLSDAISSHRLRVAELGYAPGLAFVIATALAFHLYSLHGKPRLLWWYVVLMVLLVGQVLAFQKDGVLAAAIISFAYFRNRQVRPGYKVALGLAVGALALFVLTSSFEIEGYHLSKRFSAVDASYSFAGRQKTWQIWINQAIEQKAMLFGVGLGAIKPISQGTGYYVRDPHSVYVGLLVDFGIVGLVLYCGLLAAFWKQIGKDPDPLRRTLLRGLFWAYVATGFFDTYWRHSEIDWYMGYLFYLFAFSAAGRAAVIRVRPEVLDRLRARAASLALACRSREPATR
jgi:hypothetical protein